VRILVFNPRSGSLRGSRGREAVARARAVLGRGSEAWAADDPALRERLRGLAGADLVVIAGGDGTLHHTVNALARARGEAGEWPSLALLALGSANDYALSLRAAAGREQDLAGLAAALAPGAERPAVVADLGRVRAGGATVGWFVNFAGLGAPADWARVAESRAVRWFKAAFGYRAAYGMCNAVVVARNRRLRVAVRVAGGGERRADLFALFAGKGRYLGSGMDLGGETRLASGKLTLLCVPALPRRELTRLIKAGSGPGLGAEQVAGVEVEVEGSVRLNLDGEVVAAGGEGRVRVELDVVPGRLSWV
jgi:diacylglycerol kinase (ATP)